MSDPQDEERPANADNRRVLASLSEGPRDSGLRTGRKLDVEPPIIGPPRGKRTRQEEADDPDDDQLTLPRGGLVAMRKSGGFRFSSREIVVYHSGRVRYRDSTHGTHARGMFGQPLSAHQLAELEQTLQSVPFDTLASHRGRQSPDAFAYEFAARVERKLYRLEVYTGSMPAELVPLMEQLRALMPEEG